MGKIEDVLGSIFSGDQGDGFSAEYIDNTQLNEEQRKNLASNLARNALFEQPCHVCGESFDESDVNTVRYLGPIGGGQR